MCEAEEMGEVLNEIFTSLFMREKDMNTVELGGVNSDVLKSVHITYEEWLEVLNA